MFFSYAPCYRMGDARFTIARWIQAIGRKLSLSLPYSCPVLFRYMWPRTARCHEFGIWYSDRFNCWWRESYFIGIVVFYTFLGGSGPYRLQFYPKLWWLSWSNCRDGNGQQGCRWSWIYFGNKRPEGSSVFPDAGFYLMGNTLGAWIIFGSG